MKGGLEEAGTALFRERRTGFQDPAVLASAFPASFPKERAKVALGSLLIPSAYRSNSSWVCLFPVNPALHHPSSLLSRVP